jgi:hypothetical protein
MAVTERRSTLDETKITALLLQKKILSEGQLKAALDYQKSLGGRILDILVKLDLIRASQIDEVLKKMEAGEKTGEKAGAKGRSPGALSPGSINVSDLKMHRRLLGKLPHDLVDEHLIVLFFPPPTLSARCIILGHGRDITPEILEKVKGILGVDLHSYALSAEAARKFLEEHRGGERKPAGPSGMDETQRCHSLEGFQKLVNLEVLVTLLVKKGIVTQDELLTEAKRLSAIP